MRLRSGISTQDQGKEIDENESMGKKSASKKHRVENGVQKNNKNISESKILPRNANHNHNESETEEKSNLHDRSVRNVQSAGNRDTHQVKHNRCVLLGLKICVFFLVTLFFIVPLVVRLNPWILNEVTFMHRVSWPPFLDLTKPEDLGLSGTTNFKLQSGNGIEIGAWHVLPKSLIEDDITHEKSIEILKSSYRPAVLYLHGNAGTRAGHHRMRLYKILQSADYHVITIDYRGYGDSTGHPSSEEDVCEDAYTAYKWLRQHSIGPVYIWGHSLGSGVATKLSKKLCELDQAPEGVILEAPFNNMKDAATNHPLSSLFRHMPWFTFAFLDTLTYNEIFFASDKSISSIIVPVLILHAKDDWIVPYELGYKLYQAALSSKQVGGVEMISFEAARGFGHKHIHKAPELPEILRKFIREDKK